MFDAHRHLSDEQHLCNALYCTSHRDEWAMLEGLGTPAIGGVGALANRDLPPISDMALVLENHPHLQVGEVGLDKRFGDMDTQKTFLLAALDMAFTLGRSFTVHVVKADALFLSCLKMAGNRVPPILWHGFTGSMETAAEAVKKGCILSLGPGIEHTRLAKRMDELSSLPFAIETDYEQNTQQRPYSLTLTDQYALIGRLMHKDRETLIRNNSAKRAILTNNTPPR